MNINLDPTKLLGFRIVADLGAKQGIKLGLKQGLKIGGKRGLKTK